MIPLRDANPTRRTPWVTWGLIAACFVVFAYELLLDSATPSQLNAFFFSWGLVPARLFGGAAAVQVPGAPPAIATLFSSQFLHEGWLHILGNMLYLWIFGNNVEDRLGRIPYLAFYLAGGVVAALAQVAIDPGSQIPLIGASGAIAAVLGAYAVLYPGARVLSLVSFGFFIRFQEIPALLVLGFWFVLQLLNGVVSLGGTSAGGGVAFFAHIGGFVLGLLVGFVAKGGFTGSRGTGPGSVG